jgi:homoserine kinase type II
MSVYTTVTAEDLDAWLARYMVGGLVEHAPIAAGIENTNYFVTTQKGRYVLTLYERLPAAELPFYLNLMAHLARAGVEVPAPEPDRTGALFSLLNGKPAGLVARVEGASIRTPDVDHCAAVGDALARLHVASQSYRPRLTNRRGPAWWRQMARVVKPYLTAEQESLLAAEIRFQTGFGRGRMPKGAIHGDLFCNNVLFHDGHVAGIIDFGFAATDFFAYDLAITVNDWCIDGNGALDAPRALALTHAYRVVRPLTDDERAQWPAL